MFLPDQNQKRKPPRTAQRSDFTGICPRCNLPTSGHARDNDGQPACDTYIPSKIATDNSAAFYDGVTRPNAPLTQSPDASIPLVRTGQGRTQRDNAAVLDLWDLFMMLLGASLILIALFLAHAL